MSLTLIGYDLNKPIQQYAELHEEIKALGAWWHCLDSTWLVKTNLNIEEVRARLRTKMDPNDVLLVITAIAPAAWNFSAECSKWLYDNL